MATYITALKDRFDDAQSQFENRVGWEFTISGDVTLRDGVVDEEERRKDADSEGDGFMESWCYQFLPVSFCRTTLYIETVMVHG